MCAIALIDFTGMKDHDVLNEAHFLSWVQSHLAKIAYAVIAYNSKLAEQNLTLSAPVLFAERFKARNKIFFFLKCPNNELLSIFQLDAGLNFGDYVLNSELTPLALKCFIRNRTLVVGSVGPTDKVLIGMKLIEDIGRYTELNFKVILA